MKRISQEVFNSCNTIEDLVERMNTTIDGHKINRMDSNFKSRLDSFKEYLNKSFPELTLEQILFLDEYSYKIKEIYNWNGINDLLTLVEFELEKNK
jgi:hypothetical protein